MASVIAAGQVAQEGHVGHHGAQVVAQRRGREREPAALTEAVHGHPVGRDPGKRLGCIDGQDGVGVEATEVVVVLVEDAPRHEPTEVGRTVPVRVRRVADVPAPGALTTVVDLERGVAGQREEPDLVRQPAAAGVALVADDDRQVSLDAGRTCGTRLGPGRRRSR